jgi:hypothetical protein
MKQNVGMLWTGIVAIILGFLQPLESGTRSKAAKGGAILKSTAPSFAWGQF